jgi:antitoxin YefM
VTDQLTLDRARLVPRRPGKLVIRESQRRRYARILYMTTLSVADARANFSKVVESAAVTHERFEVTRNGARVAVLLGADDYDSLLETVAILSDSQALDAIRTGLADLAAGETVSVDEVRAAMVRAGRLVE